MKDKIHSSHPYHSGNSKSFRSSVPGTGNEDPIDVGFFLFLYHNIIVAKTLISVTNAIRQTIQKHTGLN